MRQLTRFFSAHTAARLLVLMAALTLMGSAQAGSLVTWGTNITASPAGDDYVAIARSDYTQFALTASGSIAAWGYDGTNEVTDAPKGTGYTAIAGSRFAGFALAADGSIAAWGSTEYENDDGVVERLPLIEVSNAPTGTGYTAIAGGGATGYALTANGSIVAWGSGDNGELNTPAGTGYTAIAGGAYGAVALTADGHVVGWGYDVHGQATGGPTGSGFTAIAASNG